MAVLKVLAIAVKMLLLPLRTASTALASRLLRCGRSLAAPTGVEIGSARPLRQDTPAHSGMSLIAVDLGLPHHSYEFSSDLSL